MYRISDYEFGRVVVNGRTYCADLLILPDAVVPDWWREEGHDLSVADLWEVERRAVESAAEKPAALVVGTGTYGMMNVPAETRDWLAGLGIDLHELPTAEACERYNALAARGVRVAAALHLTC
jgi:hypothetical protein